MTTDPTTGTTLTREPIQEAFGTAVTPDEPHTRFHARLC